MIPLSLTLKGIYSYQDKEQTIDFVKLSSSGLFGIFGSVGSGKSTILEAISYVLYGETERLNSRDNRSYNMMNLKSDKLLIDYTFLNAPDKQKYRFIASATRKKKRFEDVNAIERSALKLIDGEWVPISLKSAEEISGLSYINFRRTVIIPQGRFQEFLQLGDTDRSKMMKELFHLEKFDLWGKAKFLEEKNDALIQNISGQMLQLNDISEDKLYEIEKGIIETKNLLDTFQKSAHQLTVEIEVLKQLKSLFDKISIEQLNLKKLQNQKPEFDRLKSELQEFIQCTAQFGSNINKLNELKSKKSTLFDEIDKLKKQFQKLDIQLIDLQPAFEKIKEKYNSREELKKLADDYRKLLEIRIIQEEIDKLKLRLENGDKEVKKSLEKISEFEKKRGSVKTTIAKLKLNLPDLAEMAQIKAWFTQFNALKKEYSVLENEVQIINIQKDNCLKSFAGIAEKIGFELNSEKPDELSGDIEKNITQLETEIEETENELKHLKIKQGLLKFSENLNEGESCPVCGSIHHPDKMKPVDLSEKLSKVESQQVKLKSELKKQLEIEKDLNKTLTEYRIVGERSIEMSKKIEISGKNIDNHKSIYQFSKQMDESSLEKAFIDAENEKKEIGKTEIELTDIEKQLENETKNKDKYQSALHEINLAISSKIANHQTLEKQINQSVIDENSKISPLDLENKISQLEKEYQNLVTNYHSVEKQIGELKPEKDKLIGHIEAREKNHKQLVIEIEQLGSFLDEDIDKSGYNSINEIELLLKKSINIELENKKISDFEKQYYSVSEQLTNLKQQVGDKNFNDENYNQKLTEFKNLNDKINENHKNLGSLEKEKAKHERKISEKKKLGEENEQLEKRSENIKTLKSLFKSSGFVNYISSVYLQNLINSANKRFQLLTRQKLRLELTETNDIIVRDFLNEGKTRSVKTLSGGQTFQASLSLALALADSIQSINKADDNFFFLDEGFGSLDKDSLATVFESLKSLRRENRIVGVISHVEELQQEIDNYLKVENTAEMGSVIMASWE